MNARMLDRRITLQKKETTRDSIGQPIVEWVDVATLWANIKYPSGKDYSKEYISAGRETSVTVASMRIRKREVDVTMRILYNGGAYEITAALPDGMRHINLATKKVE